MDELIYIYSLTGNWRFERKAQPLKCQSIKKTHLKKKKVKIRMNGHQGTLLRTRWVTHPTRNTVPLKKAEFGEREREGIKSKVWLDPKNDNEILGAPLPQFYFFPLSLTLSFAPKSPTCLVLHSILVLVCHFTSSATSTSFFSSSSYNHFSTFWPCGGPVLCNIICAAWSNKSYNKYIVAGLISGYWVGWFCLPLK